jgi:hypothetical protein
MSDEPMLQTLVNNHCDCDEGYTCVLHKLYPHAPMPDENRRCLARKKGK